MRVSFPRVTALAGGALLCLSGAAQAQNLLLNPDLDTTSVSTQVLATPDNWVAASSKTLSGVFNDGMSSEGFANVLQAGGKGLFFKPFAGNLSTGDKVTGSLTQTVAGQAGGFYTFQMWAGAENNYAGLSDPTVRSLLVMEFLDAGNAVIGSSTLDLRATGLGLGAPDAPATGFHYHRFGLAATAPALTTQVRVSAQMIDAYGTSGGQAFVVDSASLTVPEPATLGLLAAVAPVLARRRRA